MELLERDKEEADGLFYQITYGSREEQARARDALRLWVGIDADRIRYVEKLGEFDRVFDPHLPGLRDEYKRAFDDMAASAPPLPPLPRTPSTPSAYVNGKRRSKVRQVLVASGVSAICATAAAVYFINPVLSTQTFRSDIGQQTQVALSDGSRLLLNTATSGAVEYRVRSREVSLASGEAMFSVEHNSLRPFIVNAGDARIEDIGTVFSVRNLDQHVVVAVLQGEVEMSSQSSNRRMFLHAHEAGTGDGSDIELASARSFDNLVSWKDQHLVFAGEPLALVVKELQRYRKQPIKFADQRAQDVRITGGFSSIDPDDMLKALAEVAPVTVHFQSNGVALIGSR